MSHRRLSQASDHPPLESPDAAVRVKKQKSWREVESVGLFCSERQQLTDTENTFQTEGGEGRGGEGEGPPAGAAPPHSSQSQLML